MVEELRRMKGYRQVSLPDALYREIEEAMKKGHSYTSVADFVKYVVRKELERSVSS
jgi:Arc/MetJ-type ribon-helix-helix transcriptional regulator